MSVALNIGTKVTRAKRTQLFHNIEKCDQGLPFKTRFTSVSQLSAKNLCSTNEERALFRSIPS